MCIPYIQEFYIIYLLLAKDSYIIEVGPFSVTALAMDFYLLAFNHIIAGLKETKNRFFFINISSILLLIY